MTVCYYRVFFFFFNIQSGISVVVMRRRCFWLWRFSGLWESVTAWRIFMWIPTKLPLFIQRRECRVCSVETHSCQPLRVLSKQNLSKWTFNWEGWLFPPWLSSGLQVRWYTQEAGNVSFCVPVITSIYENHKVSSCFLNPHGLVRTSCWLVCWFVGSVFSMAWKIVILSVCLSAFNESSW